jgi:2-dehydropantoate 2-reductase
MQVNKSPSILVMGAGGIGGIVSGYLTEVGADISACTTNQAIHDAVQAQGFRITGDGNARNIRGRIHLGPPKDTTFDYVFLATQPPQVEEAAQQALPHLAKDGRMVVFQNGLCEQRIAAICGPERVVGGIIAWGASMIEPGLYDRTSSGGFQIGTLNGAQDEDRWSKLALNSCISSIGTIGGDRLGVLAKVRRYRRLGLEVFAEVVAVAKAEGIRLEKVAGTIDLNWMAITDKERKLPGSPNLAAKHAMLLAVGLRYRRLRSSMLSAIERGRPPSIDFLNGEVVKLGEKHGIATPVNTLIVDTIHSIARGEKKSSKATLDSVFEATRKQNQ